MENITEWRAEWLKQIGLERYASAFERRGWDHLEGLHLINEDEMKNIIPTWKDTPGHLARLNNAIKLLKDNQEERRSAPQKTLSVGSRKTLLQQRKFK